MTDPEAPVFRALLAGACDFRTRLDRLGYSGEPIHVKIPSRMGQALARELQSIDPQFWECFTDGIEVLADGNLHQMTIAGDVAVAWKPKGVIRNRKERNRKNGIPYGPAEHRSGNIGRNPG